MKCPICGYQLSTSGAYRRAFGPFEYLEWYTGKLDCTNYLTKEWGKQD